MSGSEVGNLQIPAACLPTMLSFSFLPGEQDPEAGGTLMLGGINFYQVDEEIEEIPPQEIEEQQDRRRLGNLDNRGELAHTPWTFCLSLDTREKRTPFLLGHCASGPFCFGGRAYAQTATDDKGKALSK